MATGSAIDLLHRRLAGALEHVSAGRDGRALALAELAVEEGRQVVGPQRPGLGLALHNPGAAQYRLERHALARTNLEQAAGLLRSPPAPPPPHTPTPPR